MQTVTSIWNTIKLFLKKLTAKKILLASGCLLLALSPAICSLLYVQYTDHTYHSDQFAVTLYDKNGVELIAEAGNPEKATPGSMVDIFYQIQNNKAPLSKAPASSKSDTFIVAKISLNGVASELKCYFSALDSKGYCIDQTGKIYSISSSINNLFLLSPYGELFYKNAIIPTLSTIDGDAILPFSNEWYYQAVDGQYLLAERNQNELEHTTYEITGALGIQFNSHPDNCKVSIYKNKSLYKTCGIDELPSIPVEAGTLLTIDIQAEWLPSNDRDYYGSIHYNFDTKIRNPSTFSVNTETVTAGGLLLMTCTNVTDPAKIKFTSNPSDFEAIFEWDPKTAIAHGILPIPLNTNVKSLNFGLSYGASTKNFEITIETPTTKNHENLDWNVPAKLLDLERFQNDMNAPLSYRPPITVLHHFRGNFLDPQSEGFEIAYRHGDRLQINGRNFTAYGTEFVTDQTDDVRVRAWNHGVVLDTGRNSSIGNFVIVDHGCGLRTVYGALDRIDVEAGEIVQKGQQLGSTSTDTRSGKNGFLVFCTVGTTMIDPTCVMGKDLKF